MSLCSLFVPERILVNYGLSIVLMAVIASIAVFVFIRPTADSFISERRIGVIIVLCAILPMSVLNAFKFATAEGLNVGPSCQP